MKKYNRRDLIRLGAISAGMLTLPACLPSSDHDEKSRDNDENNSRAETNDQEDLNLSMSRENILSMMEQRSALLMKKSGHCAQSCFLAIKEQFNLEEGAVVKALTPLPGLGEKGLTCGALTGCLMAMGLIFGRDNIEDWDTYRESLKPAGSFVDEYRQKLGSIHCREILEEKLGKAYDLSDETEQAEYVRAGGPEKCAELIGKAVRIAGGVILEYKYGK